MKSGAGRGLPRGSDSLFEHRGECLAKIFRLERGSCLLDADFAANIENYVKGRNFTARHARMFAGPGAPFHPG
jgi:hypothetical protein